MNRSKTLLLALFHPPCAPHSDQISTCSHVTRGAPDAGGRKGRRKRSKGRGAPPRKNKGIALRTFDFERGSEATSLLVLSSLSLPRAASAGRPPAPGGGARVARPCSWGLGAEEVEEEKKWKEGRKKFLLRRKSGETRERKKKKKDRSLSHFLCLFSSFFDEPQRDRALARTHTHTKDRLLPPPRR